MGESRERDGFFGKYTEHFDDNGNKIGESRERDGFFGKYTEHTDATGNKTGESREREGFFGNYSEHTDSSGSKTGESRERDGFFGPYTEHTNTQGEKVGESRERDGFIGKYTEHTGVGWFGKGASKTSGCGPPPTSSSISSGGGSGSTGGTGDAILGFLGPVALGALCVGLTFGAIWVNEHTSQFSFLWWLSLAVALVSGFFTIQILIGLAFVLGVIALVIWLIGYFFKHPW